MSMFKRSFRSSDRVEKSQAIKSKKSYHRDPTTKLSKLQRSFEQASASPRPHTSGADGGAGGHGRTPRSPPTASEAGSLTSPIVTFTVGREGRLFAAHEDVLSLSPVFAAACRGQLVQRGVNGKRIDLPDEEAEVFSCVLEYLYVCTPFFSLLERTASAAAALGEPAERHSFSCLLLLLSLLFACSEAGGLPA
jgi:hypothetical protein